MYTLIDSVILIIHFNYIHFSNYDFQLYTLCNCVHFNNMRNMIYEIPNKVMYSNENIHNSHCTLHYNVYTHCATLMSISPAAAPWVWHVYFDLSSLATKNPVVLFSSGLALKHKEAVIRVKCVPCQCAIYLLQK